MARLLAVASAGAMLILAGSPGATLAVTPIIITSASAGGVIGTQVHDTATLADGSAATGTITFNLYGPDDATCSGVVAFSDSVSVSGNGAYLSADFTPLTSGTYRWTADYSGDSDNAAVSSGCGAANESVTLTNATPAISTIAAGAVIGSAIHDTATIGFGFALTGTITFSVFGPDNATCSGAPAFADVVPIAGDGTYDSDDFTPTQAGAYRWIATYNGNGGNNAVQTDCNDESEVVLVSSTEPALTTSASTDVAIGGSIDDTATLTGAFNPTGNMTFNLYGPDDATCSSPAIFTDVVPMSGDSTVDSADYSPTALGTYRWKATYSGDSNNDFAVTGCNQPGESVVITATTPALTTVASAGGVVDPDFLFHDTATLTGGYSPTGTITFTLYAPTDATCSDPLAGSIVSVNGNGSYDSQDFLVLTAGSYRFIATYNGDANNNAVAGSCNDEGEAVVVGRTSPSLVGNASPNIILGRAAIHDEVRISGGVNMFGNVTFKLYGPNDPTCATEPAFTDTGRVAGDGTYVSALFTPTQAGTYRWTFRYSGDASNEAAGLPCNSDGQTVSVFPPPPTHIQHVDHFVVAAAGGGLIGDQVAGTPFTIRVIAVDAGGARVAGYTGTVYLKAPGWDCSAGCGRTDSFIGGILGGHSVTLSHAGAGAQLLVSRGEKSGQSSVFNVAAGAAAYLEYTGSLDHWRVGSWRMFTVAARDAAGNLLPTSGLAVTFASRGLVGSPITVETVNGVARLRLEAIKAGRIKFTISAPGMAPIKVKLRIVR